MGCRCQALERRRSSLDRLPKKNEARLVKDEESKELIADAARKFKAVKAWWQEMAKQNSDDLIKPAPASLHFPINKRDSNVSKENAVIIIQSHVRKMSKRRYYLKTRSAVSCLQLYGRAWLTMKHRIVHTHYKTDRFREESQKETEKLARTVDFMVDRHNYAELKRSALLIQSAVRLMLLRNKRAASITSENGNHVFQTCVMHNDRKEDGLTLTRDRKTEDDWINTGPNTQLGEKGFVVCPFQQTEESAATIIQKHCRCFLARKNFENKQQAIITIQRILRSLSLWRNLNNEKVATNSAIVIQSCLRGWLARRDASRRRHCIIQQIEESAATLIQKHCRGCRVRKHFENQKQAIITIQRVLRSLSLWRNFINEKVATRSAIAIQSCLRGWLARRDASRRRHCIVVIQGYVRSWLARRVYLSQKSAAIVIQTGLRALVFSRAFSAYRQAAIDIQRSVRGRITRTRLLGTMNSMEAAVVIQSYFRGWIARRTAAREKRLIVLIQANWKGYIARRDAKGQQLEDLRRRVQESAANVDDGMRLINRHISALNELLSMKSLSNILRNCATLDKATGLSSNCCEILVEAGAIDILLKQIKSVSRSIPDQEILKHTLSILRNLARYPHLADTLISHRGSVETILWEMLRNKEEGYFIACDLLKKICMRRKGIEAMHMLPSLLKRFAVLVDEMSRKVSKEKRIKNLRASTRDNTEKRLQEAIELLTMIKHGGDYLYD